jgi:hypothetical protein
MVLLGRRYMAVLEVVEEDCGSVDGTYNNWFC